MRIEYIIPAKTAIIDASSKSLSLIELVEEISVQSDLVEPPYEFVFQCDVVLNILRENESGILHSSLKLELVAPNKEITIFDSNFQFKMESLSNRLQIRFLKTNLVFSQPGRCGLQATLNENSSTKSATIDFLVDQTVKVKPK